MPVNVIDVIKPKNNGSFPVVEDVDVKMSDGSRLNAAIESKANKADLNAKADKSNTYTKSEVDENIETAKVDAYTKTESDGKYATKTESDTKADKSEVNAIAVQMESKADISTTADLQNQIDSFDKTPEVDEVVNARNSISGNTYSEIKKRLDVEYLNLSSDLYNLYDAERIGFEQGWIDSNTGRNTSATNRCRTKKFLLAKGKVLKISTNGMQYNIGIWNGDEFNGLISEYWITNTGDYIRFDTDKYIVVGVRKSDDSDFTPENITANISVLTAKASNLSESVSALSENVDYLSKNVSAMVWDNSILADNPNMVVYKTAKGQASESANYTTSNLYPVTAGDVIDYALVAGSTAVALIAAFDESRNFIRNVVVCEETNVMQKGTYTVDENECYVKFCASISKAESCDIMLNGGEFPSRLQAKIEELEKDTSNINLEWEQGYFLSSTGLPYASVKGIRVVGYLPDYVSAVHFGKSYKVKLSAFDENDTYMGELRNDIFEKNLGSNYRHRNRIDVDKCRKNFPTYKFKLCAVSVAGNEVVPEDSSDILIIDKHTRQIIESVRPSLITFFDDDGIKSALDNWEKVGDIVGHYPTLGIITSKVDGSAGTTWEDLKRLYNKGFDIISHTHNDLDLSDVSAEECEADCIATIEALRSHGLPSDGIAYPLARISAENDLIVKKYFRFSFGGHVDRYNELPLAMFGMNRESIFDVDSPRDVTIIDEQGVAHPNCYRIKTKEMLHNMVDNAVSQNLWLCFGTHFRNEYSSGYYVNDDLINAIIDVLRYAAKQGMKAVTAREGLEIYRNALGNVASDTYYCVDANGVVSDSSK